MTINDRIKQIRKESGCNQREFASQLGLTQSGVSYMEQPGSTVADSSIKSICSIYNLNEEWLRHGVEPKNIVTDTFSLDGFVDSKGGTAEEKEMLKEAIQLYFEFEPYVRQSLLNTYMNKVHPKQARNPLFDGIPDTPEELERMYPVIDMKKNKKDIG
ncbi:helix-turn-helix domain-containing protein [Lacrimispora amygdalina]|uniref:helix-turn-helix domain-containing protein n=1 Tax=Lacrimispora amygdalina TaxID=253257 RepID=UPI0014792DF6|nr:helix-turn-helix transcriptional regulator [Clostridium indicum]